MARLIIVVDVDGVDGRLVTPEDVADELLAIDMMTGELEYCGNPAKIVEAEWAPS